MSNSDMDKLTTVIAASRIPNKRPSYLLFNSLWAHSMTHSVHGDSQKVSSSPIYFFFQRGVNTVTIIKLMFSRCNSAIFNVQQLRAVTKVGQRIAMKCRIITPRIKLIWFLQHKRMSIQTPYALISIHARNACPLLWQAKGNIGN